MVEKENEISEDLQEFVEQARKEELPVEITREEFLLEVTSAYDFYAGKFKIAQDNMQIAVNLVQRSNDFENSPDFRVVYLKFPDGRYGLSIESKEELGFKFPDRKEEDGEGERD